MKIVLEHLTKQFPPRGRKAQEPVTAVSDFNFEVPDGQLIGLLGPSGCGKSTTLNMICGLEKPTSGRILFGDDDVTSFPPERRGVGMVFQNYALYPHLTVKQNILFPLQNLKGKDKLSRSQMDERAQNAARLVQITELMDRRPSELSGGQQQRVAIARALATHPKILLCDEATSALDPQTTQSILSLIRDIHDRLGITVIIITHQMSVVEQICTRVAILDGGTVAEEGAVSGVFSSPKSEAAKRLVYPEGYQNPVMSGEDGAVIRVVFNGANATETPLIAKMAMEENIAASILSASTRSIGDKAYGNMLLGISGGKEQTQRALDYLGSIPDIFVEEVKQ